MSNVRIGIIGTGNRGLQLYETIRERYHHHDITVLCDINEHRLKRFAEMINFQGRLCLNSDELFTSKYELDAVIITSSDDTHDSLALLAASHGKHILCEKPLAHSLEAARAILQRSAQNLTIVHVGYVLRYTRLYRTLKAYLDTGVIGRVRLVTAFDLVQGAKYFRRWHRHFDKSHGIFMHKSIHTFDLLTWFLKEAPVDAQAFGRRTIFNPIDYQYRRCRDCDQAHICRFYFNIYQHPYQSLYLMSENGDSEDINDICVYNSKKDIIDHATVIFDFPNTLVNYTLSLFSPRSTRRFLFVGDEGELECDETERRLEVRRFGRAPRLELIEPDNASRHSGGDAGLLEAFFGRIDRKEYLNTETIESLASIDMAVKAEDALQRPVMCS